MQKIEFICPQQYVNDLENYLRKKNFVFETEITRGNGFLFSVARKDGEKIDFYLFVWQMVEFGMTVKRK